MKLVFKPTARALLLSVTTAALLATPVSADCTYELFNIASVKGTSVGEFIDQISDECGMSVIVADSEAENVLKKQMNKTYLKNLTINEVLDLIVKENNLQYTLENNVLKISYLTTKTYSIDYIISKRKSEASTNVTLTSQATESSGGMAVSSDAGSNGSSGGTTSGESGTNIISTDEVLFWETLDKELGDILNRPEDTYKAASPMINKHSGLVTVSGTGKQIKRLDSYLEQLEKKMQTQVLIDVKMYNVTFSDSKTKGIDWSQLYALQKGTFSYTGESINGTYTDQFKVSVGGTIDEIIKFLDTQGDVTAISNPKILTSNNQPALITSGTELFYKIKNATTSTGTATTTSENETISSVFAGVLLDITPEISKDGTIMLRINPSISEPASFVSPINTLRSMPPDLLRRQISSVVSVKDGGRIILGGLINTKTDTQGNQLPLLGDIPIIGWLFKTETFTKQTQEMVIIIEPHIIKSSKDTTTLADLGYSRMDTSIDKIKFEQSELEKSNKKDFSEVKENSK